MKQNIWGKVFVGPPTYFYKSVKDIKSHDDLKRVVGPMEETDFYLDVYLQKKYSSSNMGFLSILTLGLVPTREKHEYELSMTLYSKDKNIIGRSLATDKLKYSVSTLPYGKGMIASHENIEGVIYPKLVKKTLSDLLREVKP